MLLHGLGDSHELWRHQVGPLSERYDVITPDLRGHGRSDLGGTRFTLADLASDVVEIVTDLQLRRPVIVGLSMGGGVAQSIAVGDPSLPRALVLVSTSSELPEFTRQRMLSRAKRAERDGMTAVVDETVPRWFTSRFTVGSPDQVAWTRRVVLNTPPAAFAAASRANAARHLTPHLGRIRCPVLFVGGAADPAEPQRALQIYRERISDVEAEIVPDTSHLVPVEAPDTFTAVLLRFLERVEASAAASEGGEQT